MGKRAVAQNRLVELFSLDLMNRYMNNSAHRKVFCLTHAIEPKISRLGRSDTWLSTLTSTVVNEKVKSIPNMSSILANEELPSMPKAKKPANVDEIKDKSQNTDEYEESEEEDRPGENGRPEVFDANSYLEQRIQELHREKREDLEHTARQIRRAANRGGHVRRGKRYTITSSGNSSGSEDEKSDDMRGKKVKRTTNKLPPVGGNKSST